MTAVPSPILVQPARFSAYAAADGRAHAIPEAESFAEAALLFTEVWRHDEDGELRIIVVDHRTGERECFCVEVGTAAVEPCKWPDGPR